MNSHRDDLDRARHATGPRPRRQGAGAASRQGIGIRPAEAGFVRSRGHCSLYRQALTTVSWILPAPPVANLCSVVLGFGGRPPEEIISRIIRPSRKSIVR